MRKVMLRIGPTYVMHAKIILRRDYEESWFDDEKLRELVDAMHPLLRSLLCEGNNSKQKSRTTESHGPTANVHSSASLRFAYYLKQSGSKGSFLRRHGSTYQSMKVHGLELVIVVEKPIEKGSKHQGKESDSMELSSHLPEFLGIPIEPERKAGKVICFHQRRMGDFDRSVISRAVVDDLRNTLSLFGRTL